jgi:hypothetical protein
MIEYTVKVSSSGAKFWYLNDQLHREDGPAIEYSNGTKFWYLNDELHREDGPAAEYSDGTKGWFLNGVELSEEEYNNKMKPSPFNGKLVTIDGKQYKLTEVR